MSDLPKRGDEVAWNSGSGEAVGKVVKRIQGEATVDGREVHASKDDPRILVKNLNTGNLTVRRPEALHEPGERDDHPEDGDSTVTEFRELVNMDADELTDWLETEQSRRVGQDDGGESVGHRMGRRIVEILNTDSSQYRPGDFEAMRKVNGYIKRHLKQRPSGDPTNTRWRYSLKNWGHEPCR